MKVSGVAKFLVSGLTAVLLAVLAAITDEQITREEVVGIALAALGALGVYAVPNRRQVPPLTEVVLDDGESAAPDQP